MDIVKLMAEYNLTLRHMPKTLVGYRDYRGNELKENEELVIRKWRDGSERKMVKITHHRETSEWLCMQVNNWHEMQSWVGCFYGATAEEAVNNCVSYINNEKNGHQNN